MTEKKQRFTFFKSKIRFGKQGIEDNLKGYTFDFTLDNVLDCMNDIAEENEQLKRRNKVLREENGKLRKKRKDERKPILQLIDEHNEKWFKKQREAEQGRGWGNSTRYLCYQVALTHLKKEIIEND